jgi:hypothetical protein
MRTIFQPFKLLSYIWGWLGDKMSHKNDCPILSWVSGSTFVWRPSASVSQDKKLAGFSSFSS